MIVASQMLIGFGAVLATVGVMDGKALLIWIGVPLYLIGLFMGQSGGK